MSDAIKLAPAWQRRIAIIVVFPFALAGAAGRELRSAFHMIWLHWRMEWDSARKVWRGEW